MPRRTPPGPAPLPEVGPWARDKLDRLGSYLSAYTKILSKQAWAKTVYIDAFAAAGRAVLRELDPGQERSVQGTLQGLREPADDSPPGDDYGDDAQELIDGSPRVALDIEPPFDQYVFIERDPERLDHLRALEREYSGRRRITVHEGDCNEYLATQVPQLFPKNTGWRGVVFLDPYGMQVPWGTVEALARTGMMEAFINFPLGMAIRRLLKNTGEFSAAERSKLDSYFGDPGWFNVVYQPQGVDLFGAIWNRKTTDSTRKLLDWYRARLKKHFGHASPGYLVKNSIGGDLYYLLFAGPNANGAKIASHVLGGGTKVQTS